MIIDVLSLTIKILKEVFHSLKTYCLQVIELPKGLFKNWSLLQVLNSEILQAHEKWVVQKILAEQ